MSKKSAAEASRAERTAALMKEQERTERRRQLLIVGAVMAVLAVIVGVTVVIMSKADKTSNSTVGSSDYSFGYGDPDAPHQVVIYEDFLCPVCQAFEGLTNEKLTQAADDGKVYIEYRPFELLSQFGPYSSQAANAFRAVWENAGEAEAKKMHDLLYEQQPSEEGPYPDAEWLIERAVEAGADEDAVRSAIEDESYMDWVDDATADAVDAGVRGTPTVYLDGKIVDQGSLEERANALFDAIGVG